MDNGVFMIEPELLTMRSESWNKRTNFSIMRPSVKVVSFRRNSRELTRKESGYNVVTEKFVMLVKKYSANGENLSLTSFEFEDNLFPFENVIASLV